MMKQLLIILLMLAPLGMRAQESDMNLDSIYMSYMSDSSKTKIMKVRNQMARIEQQSEERKNRRLLWNLILLGCAVTSVTITAAIFREVFKDSDGAPLINKLRAGAICLCGGIVIFLLDVAWFYMSFDASQKAQKLILFAILLVLGIALWIYTKNLKNNHTEEL